MLADLDVVCLIRLLLAQADGVFEVVDNDVARSDGDDLGQFVLWI